MFPTVAIKGKVRFAAEVSHALSKAPEKFRSGILGSLLTERDGFVGSSKKDGVFTKKIMRKSNIRGGHWPRNVARIFGGRVDEPSKTEIDGMRLVMGVGESGRSKYRHKAGYGVGTYTGAPFRDVMDFLSTGGPLFPRLKDYMIMPIYRNLENTKKVAQQWKFMRDNDLLEWVHEGERIYYFKKNGTGGSSDLLFIGIKAATVNQQYNFYGDWNRRLPSVYNRVQKRIDRITNRINGSTNG